MFIRHSRSPAARNLSILLAVLLAFTGSYGALLTMHFFVAPPREKPKA